MQARSAPAETRPRKVTRIPGLWKKASEDEQDPLVDADGCVERLYFYLWCKNKAGNSCPGIAIPDTVRKNVGCIFLIIINVFI